MAGGVIDRDLETGEAQRGAVGQLRDVVRLRVRQAAAEQRRQVHAQALGRVGQHLPVGRVHIRRDPARAAHRRDREGVVEVPVGEQDRCRVQAVLGQHRVQLIQHADARVDHQALLPRAGGHDVAVGAEGLGRKAGDEHSAPLSSSPVTPSLPVPPMPGRTLHTVTEPRTTHSQGVPVHSCGRVAWRTALTA